MRSGTLPVQRMGVMYRPPLPAPEPLKRCAMCEEWSPRDEFGKDKGEPDGLRVYDLRCEQLYNMERRASISARRLVRNAANRRYWNTHPEYREAHRALLQAQRAKNKEWHQLHPESNRAACARYRARHRLELNAKVRARYWAQKIATPQDPT